MSDLIGLGLSGLQAYRTALSAVGDNVANAETPGFARRSVKLVPGVAGGARLSPYYPENYVFGGVRIQGITRGWDEFKAAEARYATAAAGRTSVREQWFTNVETALDDGPGGIGAKLTNFFNVADDIAAAPGESFGRSRLLSSLDDAAGAFRNNADRLTRISDGIATAAELDVDTANNAIAALAKLNVTIRITADGGTVRAALEDERERLIGTISERIGVLAQAGDDGTVRLVLADDPATVLVGPNEAASFAVTAAADGRLTLQLTNSSGTAALTPSSGRFAGLIDAANGTADRRSDLDTLAADFASQVNAWSAAGRDSAGVAGQPLLAITAGAATLRGTITDPALVPAASADGTANGNLLALDALRGATGVERRWTGIVARHAQQLASARSENAATVAWRDNSFAALDEATGIDLDREAADLLRFQQAYTAAARVIQVGRDIMQEIFRAL